jgi:periplasmic protein TonB
MVNTLATPSQPLPLALPWKRLDYSQRGRQSSRKVVFLAMAIALEAAIIWGVLSLDITKGIIKMPLPAPIRLLLPDPTPAVKPPDPVPQPVKQVQSVKPLDPPPIATEQIKSEQEPVVTTFEIPATSGPIDPPKLAAIDPQPAQPLVRKGMTPVYRVSPAYPITARRNGTEGRVVAHLHVNPDGTVRQVQIVESSPRSVFEREVVKALMQWRFAPEAVGFVGEVEIGFRLSGTETEG